MQRYRGVWFVIGLLVLTSLACHAFAGDPGPGLLPPPGLTAVPATPATPAGNLAPTVTLPGETAVPTIPAAAGPTIRMLVDLNIRSGPGVQYPRVGFLRQGETAPVIGRHAASGWWRIQCPPLADGDSCWVSGGAQYAAAANADNVPSLPAPPLPTPTRPR